MEDSVSEQVVDDRQSVMFALGVSRPPAKLLELHGVAGEERA
jgi:hypothetical protein